MEKETLSDKSENHINQGYGDGCSFCDYEHEGVWYREKDVKDFIRQLKEEFGAIKPFNKRIDKLAGDKLI